MNINRGKLIGIVGLLPGSCTVMVVAGWAQGPRASPSPTPAASDGTAEGATVAIVILGLLVAAGVAVKLHDVSRKREDEAAALQGRISRRPPS
jgi:hypothetical protein